MTWAEFVARCIPSPTTITVQPWTGSGAYGDTYGDSFELELCVVEDCRRAVTVQTQDAYGSEALSSTWVYGPLDPEIKPGSLITLPWRQGRPAKVLSAERITSAGYALPEHQELALE